MKKIFIYILITLILVFISVLFINLYVLSFSKTHYYFDLEALDKKYVWLVFWASVKSNLEPSDILKDRLKVAYRAYDLWKIEKIIVSWDNSKKNYNEPLAMQKYLLSLWVNRDDIYLDYAWFDTYDSIYRAKNIFGVNEIVLFTQDFHLKRAMYISNRLHLETFWVETNLQKYLLQNYNNTREIFARIKAFFEIEIFKSKSKYLWDKIEILSDEKIEEAKKRLIKE
jgi:SanA protein